MYKIRFNPKFAIFGMLCLSSLVEFSGFSYAQEFVDLGTLTSFYRSTQLQGHLIGMGLIHLPSYVLNVDDGLSYDEHPSMEEQIPFADTFVINRFLGGYRSDWLKKFGYWDDTLGRSSLDYAIKEPDGTLHFRPELIRRRLEPYISAGYSPNDITIALDNVPWDLATLDNRPPESGPWGRRSPPGDLDQWRSVIWQFATDLRSYLGSAATDLRFETGIEYDEKASFDAGSDEFFSYYKATFQELHKIFPGLSLTPGEFTGLGTCQALSSACVYDTRDFISFARENDLSTPYIPRSLNSFLDRPQNASPFSTWKRAAASYDRLPPVVSEIHQFGLLNEPFGSDGSDVGALQANWEFQVLVRLWETPKPQRIFHWGGFITVGRTPILNGSGFLRLVLDHYLGANGYIVNVADTDKSQTPYVEVLALRLVGSQASGLIISSFSTHTDDSTRLVTVQLPRQLTFRASELRTIRYRGTDNIFVHIRNDLAAENNLKADFAASPFSVAAPAMMAIDANEARAMISRNWPKYETELRKSLQWVHHDTGVSLDGAQIRADLQPNELIVIEADRN